MWRCKGAFTLFSPRRPAVTAGMNALPGSRLASSAASCLSRYLNTADADGTLRCHLCSIASTLATAHPMRRSTPHSSDTDCDGHLDVSPGSSPSIPRHPPIPTDPPRPSCPSDPGSRHCRHTGRLPPQRSGHGSHSLRHNRCTSLVMALSSNNHLRRAPTRSSFYLGGAD